ncbi:hypothetical protein ACKWTF_014398 [Chironomus riparius]
MRNFSVILVVLAVQVVYGHYQGPFLLWGVENLNEMKIPALQAIEDQNLQDIYTKASAIVIFIRNATTKLSYENFPELSDIINKNEWLYLPQELLSSDPLDYNVNANVLTLTGSSEAQDSQIAAFYHDAQVKFGNKNILGIIAESNEHLRSKREVTTDLSIQEPTETLIYEAPGKCLLYTRSAPILSLTEKGVTNNYELKEVVTVSADTRNDEVMLIVNFTVSGNPVTISFIFYLSGGNWYLTHIEYGDKAEKINVVGTRPSAPFLFSYACGDNLMFKSENVSLTLKGFQVQPLLNGARQFSRAYDCTGFMSAPILAGLFITAILLFVLTIAITAILDIKTPTRFENRHSKPLTFNVQE